MSIDEVINMKRKKITKNSAEFQNFKGAVERNKLKDETKTSIDEIVKVVSRKNK